MAKHKRRFLKKKWIRFGFVPAILLTLWVLFTSWYIILFDESALVISYNHGEENFTSISHERLVAGEKLSGQFVAQDKNLGIVALRFEHFQRIPYDQEDTLIFRLKEKGAQHWYYENEYRSGLTYDVPFLPFGFPIISDSKGKIYVFELESREGNRKNAVVLSHREPFLVSKYQQDKSVLLNNPQQLIDFGYKKFFNSFDTIDIAYSSFVFSLPFLFYLSWISPLKGWIIDPVITHSRSEFEKRGKKLFGSKYPLVVKGLSTVSFHWMLVFVVFVILGDILLLQILNDLLYFSAIGLWMVLLWFYHKDSRMSYLVGIGFLLIAPIALEFNNVGMAEKAGAWAFMFFVAGLLQDMYLLRKQKVGTMKHV